MIKIELDKIVTAKSLQQHLASILYEVEEEEKLYIITKQGKPKAALINVGYLAELTGQKVEGSEEYDQYDKFATDEGLETLTEKKPITLYEDMPVKPIADDEDEGARIAPAQLDKVDLASHQTARPPLAPFNHEASTIDTTSGEPDEEADEEAPDQPSAQSNSFSALDSMDLNDFADTESSTDPYAVEDEETPTTPSATTTPTVPPTIGPLNS